MDEIKILIINESTSQSIISDIWSGGIIFAGFFVNFYCLGNSVILQVLWGVIALMVVRAKGSPKIKRMAPLEALEYLTEKYGETGGDGS